MATQSNPVSHLLPPTQQKQKASLAYIVTCRPAKGHIVECCFQTTPNQKNKTKPYLRLYLWECVVMYDFIKHNKQPPQSRYRVVLSPPHLPGYHSASHSLVCNCLRLLLFMLSYFLQGLLKLLLWPWLGTLYCCIVFHTQMVWTYHSLT